MFAGIMLGRCFKPATRQSCAKANDKNPEAGRSGYGMVKYECYCCGYELGVVLPFVLGVLSLCSSLAVAPTW